MGTPQRQALGQAALLQRGLSLLVQRVNLQRHGRAPQLVHLQQRDAQPRGHLPPHIYRPLGVGGTRCLRALQRRRPRLLLVGKRPARGLLGGLLPAVGVQHHAVPDRGRERHGPTGVPLHQRLVPRVPGLLATDGHTAPLLPVGGTESQNRRLLLHHRP